MSDGQHPNAWDAPPARRTAPKDHLARAAKTTIGSDAEQYHLQAAIAEALMRIEEHLAKLVRGMQ